MKSLAKDRQEIDGESGTVERKGPLRGSVRKPGWRFLPGRACGFSLLEVMIAAAIFAIVALGLAQYQSYLVQKRVVARRYTQAVNFAEQKVEELRNIRYSNIPVGTVTETSVNGDANFSRVTTVTGFTYYKTISVQVEWMTPGGTTYHTPALLETIVAE